jgi:hypothetical protein
VNPGAHANVIRTSSVFRMGSRRINSRGYGAAILREIFGMTLAIQETLIAASRASQRCVRGGRIFRPGS